MCPRVHQELQDAGRKYNFDICYAGSPKNVWIRDYMPVATETGNVKFIYKRERFKNYPQLELASRDTDFFTDRHCGLVLDGGNVVQSPNYYVVCTDMIFSWNRGSSKSNVVKELEKQFQKKLFVIPHEPGDTLGHTDGILQFFNGNVAFVNRYRKMGKSYDRYKVKLYGILERAGIEIVEFPYAYYKCPQPTEEVFRLHYPDANDFNPAVGYYINYLRFGDLFFLPVFGFDEDAEAEETILKNIPTATIVKINCFDLAMMGGLVHCVTWEN